MIRVYRSEKFYYNGRAVGWVMKCPRCGSSLASGSMDCPKPEFSVCDCDKKEV